MLSIGARLLICGLLTGVVVAAAAFPAVAIAGLVAKSGAEEFDRLPSQLLVQQSPQISYVYASDRKTLIATFYDENRRDVRLADVAPVMRQAIVAAEDMRFYEHHGVDVKGVARAYVANRSAGETQQGASTLTMQYVRQALEYSASTPQEVVDATSDTVGRKLREMRYALAVEKQLTKDQILERYLNIAPFGHGAFGIYAAAQVYFNKQPKNLTLAEAALLAGLVKAPSAYDPTTEEGQPAALDRRNNYVLANMVKMGYLSAAQRQETIKEPVKITGRSTPNGCTAVTDNGWGFFCDYLYRWWLNQSAFGADVFEREARLKSGGYAIYSSLDVNAQASAKRNVEKYDRTGSNPTALMLAGVEPGTGRIELMAANRTYSNDQGGNGPNSNPQKRGQKGTWPNTTNPLISGGGDISGYQFGSSFKVFTLVGALEKGVPLNHTISTAEPHDQHRVAVRVAVHHRPAQPGRVQRQPLLPGQRQPAVDERTAQHVDRPGPLGQHLLGTAGVGDRRPERGERRQAARHPVPGAQRRRPGQQRLRLGSIHPRRLRRHPAGHGQRLRHPGRRWQVLRAAAGRRDPRLQRGQAGRRQPPLPPGGRLQHRARGHRRDALPDR